ncbi:MAG: hypothetical protein PHV60_06570 [bacterium]|nr:hypothetical protein [bacterium]
MKKYCFVLLTIMLMLITGCQNKTETVNYHPPQNPLVAKPDEIYVGTPKYITRVKTDSPWFNAFWAIADKGVKATKIIYHPTGNRLFEMSNPGVKEPPSEKCGRFLPHKPFLPEPLKEGETILADGELGKKEEASVFMVMWYKKPVDLMVGDYPPNGPHLEEVQKLGFPMRPDGTLQGTQKVILDGGRDYYYGGVAYYGHSIDKQQI